MPQTLLLTATVTATVVETWEITVPDDFDVTDRDAVEDAFYRPDLHGAITSCIGEQATDERDREIDQITPSP